MILETRLRDTTVSLHEGDITTLDVEAFVYYARSDLSLGSGFGTAISIRGGLSIQEELKQHGHLLVTQAVITGAGKLKAKHIIHAVGPKFQDEELEQDLGKTMCNALKLAQEHGIQDIAFPLMGAGFYGVLPESSARIMFEALDEHLRGPSTLKRVIISTVDERQSNAVASRMKDLIRSEKEPS